MTPNSYTGEVILEIGKKEYILKYDWKAIGKLRSELGSDFDEEISRASVEMDMPIIAKILSIGLERHHSGEMTVNDIMEVSPPIISVSEAIHKAIRLSFYGIKEEPATAENPAVKMRLLKSLKTLLSALKKSSTATA